MRTFDLVVAADAKLGIGKDGTLPWKLSKDMAYFKRVTSKVQVPTKRNAVIMGRKTWESIPPRFRPLPDRFNLVLTRNVDFAPGSPDVLVSQSLDMALETLSSRDDIENIFVIGGGQIFAEAMQHPACRILYLTEIHHDFDCDVFLADYRETFVPCAEQPSEMLRENGIEYEFSKFIHKSKSKTGQSNCVGVAT
jgi:dihydrofolate reductase